MADNNFNPFMIPQGMGQYNPNEQEMKQLGMLSMLQAALAMASQPRYSPYKRSLGEMVAPALSQGLNAYSGGLQNLAKQKMLADEMAQKKLYQNAQMGHIGYQNKLLEQQAAEKEAEIAKQKDWSNFIGGAVNNQSTLRNLANQYQQTAGQAIPGDFAYNDQEMAANEANNQTVIQRLQDIQKQAQGLSVPTKEELIMKSMGYAKDPIDALKYLYPTDKPESVLLREEDKLIGDKKVKIALFGYKDATGKEVVTNIKPLGGDNPPNNINIGFKNDDYAMKLRKELEDKKEVKDWRDIVPKFAVMQQALKEGINNTNKVAVDQAIITLFNKMTDPQSVVRESEYARTPQDLALWNRLKGKVNKWQTGGAGLTDEDRVALVTMGSKFGEEYQKKVAPRYKQFQGIAKKRGISDSEIFTDDDMAVISNMNKGKVIQTPKSGSTLKFDKNGNLIQ